MSAPAVFPSSFVRPWKELLASHQAGQANDFPSHHVDSLVTTSSPKSLHVGTGHSIYTRALLPAILSAKHSVHFVTCYWAASPTLDAIRDTLVQLATARRPRGDGSPPLRIAIGFSSRGLFQKLLHTSSRDGYIYLPSQWGKLGLPHDAMLRSGGVELTVKSLFFTPLSVMHPKYVIIDGQRAFVPSCNVSWERWFEGCVELEGDVVRTLLAFHGQVWGTGCASPASSDGLRQDRSQQIVNAPDGVPGAEANSTIQTRTDDVSPAQSTQLDFSAAVPTIVLPSPHHRNPRFNFFPFLSQTKPPMTPLNAALLTLFTNARRKITILTPNVTSGPVVDALLEALDRGVDVQIRTSKNMMVIEQLVTAGTTTSRCIQKLINEYKKLQWRKQTSDLEAQPVPPGKLEVLYFRPLMGWKQSQEEPVLSHFKMTLVDDEYLVLGSGNMDRASWWTSQELGILFYVAGFGKDVLWDRVLERRTEVAFRSRDG